MDAGGDLVSEVNQLKAKLEDAMNQIAQIHEFYRAELAKSHEEVNSLRQRLSNNTDANMASRRKLAKNEHVSSDINHANVGSSVVADNSNDNQSGSQPVTNAANVSIEQPEFQPVRKKKKILQVIDAPLGDVLNCIKVNNCNNFTLKQNSPKAPIKIAIDKADEIPTIREALKANKISFHEFKWDCEKMSAFIIRGMCGATEEDLPEIFEELCKAGVPRSSKLSLFVTGYMKSNPGLPHNTLLKLVVPPNFDIQILKGIKYIDHVAVKFEKIKPKAVIQCLNCQRFGHSASGCQHAHRCVKCGANHLRDKCPRTFDKAVKLVCCNCNGNHTANNLSICPYFANNFGTKKDASSPTSPKPVTVAATPKAQGVSYADVLNINNRNSSGLAELSRKMDMILKLVMKHDEILQGRIAYE